MAAISTNDVLVSLAMVVAGIPLVYAYGFTARHRWGAHMPDIVTMAAYKMKPDSSWSLKERAIHFFMRLVKYIGFFLIAFGVGALIYALKTGHSLWR